MANQIPEGPKGAGLRALKEREPEVVARMGYNKGGAVINKPKKPLKEIKIWDPRVKVFNVIIWIKLIVYFFKKRRL